MTVGKEQEEVARQQVVKLLIPASEVSTAVVLPRRFRRQSELYLPLLRWSIRTFSRIGPEGNGQGKRQMERRKGSANKNSTAN